MTQTSDEQLLSIVRPLGSVVDAALFHGFAGAPKPPADPDAWRAELSHITSSRLTSLALAAAKASEVHLPAEVLGALTEERRLSTTWAFLIETAAPAVVAGLESHDVAALVTKGPGIARAYPELAHRPFRDLDVLVAPGRFSDATVALQSLGFNRESTAFEPRRYFSKYCREAVTFVRQRDGLAVDLHHHVPPWIWGRRLTAERLLDRSEELRLDRGTIRVPHRVHNLLISALHTITNRGRDLLIWRDIAQMAALCDPAEAATEASKTGTAWCLFLALNALPSYAQPRELLDRVRHSRPRPGDQMRFRRVTGTHHYLGRMFRLPTPNAVACLAAFVAPSSSFMMTRYGKRTAYPRWWRDVARRSHDINISL